MPRIFVLNVVGKLPDHYVEVIKLVYLSVRSG